MANKRISDLDNSNKLIGTEEYVIDQEADTISGFDTVKTTLSTMQEFSLSGAPFLTVDGETNFDGNVFFNHSNTAFTLSSNGDAIVRSLSAEGTGTDSGILYAETSVETGPDGYLRGFDICTTGGRILSCNPSTNEMIDLATLLGAGGTLQSVTEGGNITTESIILNGCDFNIRASRGFIKRRE